MVNAPSHVFPSLYTPVLIAFIEHRNVLEYQYFYAPASKGSVCLSVSISLLLQNYQSQKTCVWYVSTCQCCSSNEGHLSKVKVRLLALYFNTQISQVSPKIVLLWGHGVSQTYLFSHYAKQQNFRLMQIKSSHRRQI